MIGHFRVSFILEDTPERLAGQVDECDPEVFATPRGSKLNVLALCSGVGGLELGVKLARPDSRVVCYVEREAYVASLLVQRMLDQALDAAAVWSDVRSFDGRPFRGKVDLVTGGYSCQPFSLAGKRRGKDDPRHVWPAISRIIAEVGPGRCFFENVAGHLSLGFETVADDLRAMGYRVAAGLFDAEEVGAPHGRERLFIMADAHGLDGRHDDPPDREVDRLADVLQTGRDQAPGGVEVGGEEVDERVPLFPPRPESLAEWGLVRPDLKPPLCGMAHGLADRVDRIWASGNGVVPLVAAHAWGVLEAALAV